ncbi:MAG: N-acetylmuramoyl-L-alanine amidase [Candidatus Palauibacterales bacterium]|nr:N-acetylmuramoyl-L-alanine amidase [Candidatus Palauibacterales bacterium]
MAAAAGWAVALATAASPLCAQPHRPAAGPVPGSVGARGYPVVAASELPGEVLTGVSVNGDRLTATVAGRSIELRAGSPFFRDGDGVGQLVNPPYRARGSFWVPAELLDVLRTSALARGGSTAAGRSGEARGSGDPGAPSGAARAVHPGPFRIVIDPGHGGKDPGARGPRGTKEKNVALAVARRLKARLDKDPNIDASLTRSKDVFIPLAGRPKIAVERHADLFLSIHCNSERGDRARGFETYFLSPSRTEESRRVAIRENSAIQYEDPKERPDVDDINYILVANRQNVNVRESSFFAGEIQNAMRHDVTTPDRGVKQAGLYVLMGASGSMPAVLAEIGFISNPVEERFLRSSSGQDEIASALAEAVKEYASDYTQRLAATGTAHTGGR